MCLQAQGIDNDNSVASRVTRAHRLSDNDGVVGRGRGINDASEGLETTTEAAGDIQWARGIYNNNGGVGGGK